MRHDIHQNCRMRVRGDGGNLVPEVQGLIGSMTIAYRFLAPGQIVFGWGAREQLVSLIPPSAKRVWLVSGSRTLERTGVVTQLTEQIAASGRGVVQHATRSREPEVVDVDSLVAAWRSKNVEPTDAVIAIGGGSTIDLAKAAAALATNGNGESVAEYLEGVGTGRKIVNPPLMLIAVPTTAGTGSEATKNAVISSDDPPYKKSLRSDLMVPAAVVVDPELTVTVPPEITAHTGMDAITQLIEAYISRRSTLIPKALCEQGLQLAIPALPRAIQNGADRVAREAMSHAALLSGMALANSGLGLAHGVAAGLGVLCRIPHGLACAVMLPAALYYNLPVSAPELARLGTLSLGRPFPSERDAAETFVAAITDLCRHVGIPPRLRELGVPRPLLDDLVPASQGNSLSGNPRDISPAQLRELLETWW